MAWCPKHQSISSPGIDIVCSQLTMQPFMIQAGYNGSEVSTMDADGPAFQHQGISSPSTDLMCFQLTMQHFMVQAGYATFYGTSWV